MKNHRKLRVIVKSSTLTEEEALKKLCVGKVEPMDMGNHVTVFNALQNLPSPHRENLKHMGYNTPLKSFLVLLDFHAKFDPQNGREGKLPVTPKEWNTKNWIE